MIDMELIFTNAVTSHSLAYDAVSVKDNNLVVTLKANVSISVSPVATERKPGIDHVTLSK